MFLIDDLIFAALAAGANGLGAGATALGASGVGSALTGAGTALSGGLSGLLGGAAGAGTAGAAATMPGFASFAAPATGGAVGSGGLLGAIEPLAGGASGGLLSGMNASTALKGMQLGKAFLDGRQKEQPTQAAPPFAMQMQAPQLNSGRGMNIAELRRKRLEEMMRMR